MQKLAGFITLAAAVVVAGAALAENPEDPLPAGVAAFTAAYAEWDGDGFRRAAEQLQAAGKNEPESFPAHYWHGVARFHFALFLLDLENPGPEADRALDAAEEALEKALELAEECGECYALLSAITGMRIGLNPLSGIWRGSRFKRQAEKAIDLSPDNPRVHYLLGSNYYHGPERLGGKEKARERFLAAESLFEQEREKEAGPLQPRWGYDSCLAFLGRIYLEEDDREKAGEYFRRTLAVNPSHGPTRKQLLELKNGEEEDD
jgi:tetratricopeptide (TPR) repeat protein